MPIKPPSGIGVPPSSTTRPEGPASPQAPKGGQAAQAPSAVINPEAINKALKDYQKIRDKLKEPSFLKGAAGLFTDSVVFPPELLDPKDPANDPKYLHLLFAVFGLKELERYFSTGEQREELEKEEEEEEKGKKEKKGKKNTSKE